MSLRTTASARIRIARSHIRPPSALRRPSVYLGVATVGAVLVGVVTGGQSAAEVEPTASVSIADQLGISAAAPASTIEEQLAPLQQLTASRSERESDQVAAANAQEARDAAARQAAEEAARAEAARQAAEEAARAEAARQAAEQAARAEAARQAAEEAARAEAARRAVAPAAAAAAPSGSYQEYALSQLGGTASQFSCLENLWGKESGWNPNAQNPSSTAYGIAQFLDSTWASTGIAKTSNGYRQIDAGLIYINNRYGSPCGAWQHSQANNWY
jgi:hypothetical protein